MPELISVPLQSPLGSVFALIWGFLACATGFVYATFRQPLTNLAIELRDRIHTWWWIVALVTIAMALGTSTSILFIAAVSFLAFREFHSVVPIRRADRMILGLAYIAIPIQYYFVWTRWYGMFSIFVPVYAFTLLTAATVFVGETRGFIRANATLHWALILTVYNVSHLAFLTVLPLKQSFAAGGLGLLLFVLVVVQFNDVAQFFWGRLFGRTRIVPSVSPGKTWEGFVGGVVTSVLLAIVIAPRLTPFSSAAAASIGVLLAVCGFLGDVTLSAVKRDLGLKDTGTSLRGHGGILDRLDSLTLAAPIVFHVIRYFYGA
ncbi:MAG: phosphatidate cytidylyltransferase [Pseudomonadota bacterium]